MTVITVYILSFTGGVDTPRSLYLEPIKEEEEANSRKKGYVEKKTQFLVLFMIK